MYGRFGFVVVFVVFGVNVIIGTFVDFLVVKESIFVECRERWMCFYVCFWCLVVRLTNGINIFIGKK